MDPKATLQSVSMRNTAGRRAILEYISAAKSPVAVDEIITSISKLRLDQATIYRIINILTQKGILRPINFQEGKIRYELASNPHHHHVVCTNCGAVQDVDDCLRPTATATIEKATGFTIAAHALEFFGLCGNCQKLTTIKPRGTISSV